jgi:hypothetical protein
MRNSPIFQNLLLAVVLDMPKSRVKPLAVFEEGVRRWPEYYDFYEVSLTRLGPMWGGSWDAVDQFMKQRQSCRIATRHIPRLDAPPTSGALNRRKAYRCMARGGASASRTAKPAACHQWPGVCPAQPGLGKDEIPAPLPTPRDRPARSNTCALSDSVPPSMPITQAVGVPVPRCTCKASPQ